MPINITMPALSPTMEEGNLAKWLVKEGDSVAPGDVIAEIETDKATMEVEAVDEGTVAKLLVEAGTEGVKVNAVIAVLAGEGEDVSSVEVAPAPVAETVPSDAAESPDKNEPVAAPPAPATIPSPAPEIARAPSSERIFASPLARRIAKQNGVDLENIKGSGPHGRIIKRDVDGAPASATGSVSASATAVSAGMMDKDILALYAEGSYEVLPHDSMRKVIAARLTESSQTIPVYFLTMDCELDTLLALRKNINDAAPKDDEDKPAYKVSVNDFIIKAMALALRDIPMANASWTSGARIVHKHSDVGVAVAIPDGLITPIVRDAESKTLSAISVEMKDMAARAKTKKLKPEEYQGGSTAVSNLGMFGVSDFTSIINPPQASIISVGAGTQRPIVRDGALAVATVMTVTFAFDHRVIDGALGAQLAGAFKNYIEKPIGMLV